RRRDPDRDPQGPGAHRRSDPKQRGPRERHPDRRRAAPEGELGLTPSPSAMRVAGTRRRAPRNRPASLIGATRLIGAIPAVVKLEAGIRPAPLDWRSIVAHNPRWHPRDWECPFHTNQGGSPVSSNSTRYLPELEACEPRL